jgi:hypothetical protein
MSAVDQVVGGLMLDEVALECWSTGAVDFECITPSLQSEYAESIEEQSSLRSF